ncbi:hypothetical protein CZ771_00205 [Actinomycetales bacterium JB111]|nr:hypothetical protein CZ771_00205 [Actinomycetales bacterium JB111]
MPETPEATDSEAIPEATDSEATDAEATTKTEDAPTSGEGPESESEAEPAGEPASAGDDVTTVGHVRRAPRYGRFIWVGFLLGLLASILLVIFTNGASFSEGFDGVQNSQFFADTLSDKNAVGLVLLSLGPLGMLLGALVAYLLDRRSLRRRDRAITDLTDDDPTEK